jgi:hypothetical protein
MSSNTVVSIDELAKITTEQLPEAINRAIRAGRPLMIHGSPGTGKSAGVLHAAHDQAEMRGLPRVVQLGESTKPEEEYGYFDIRLTNMGPEEFGLPSADLERGIQTRLPVDWYPSTDRDDLPEFGLLVFEEMASVGPAMQAAVYQATHDKRLGDKKMKPGWSIVLTGNLLSDGGVVHKMATPLANRIVHVYATTDVDSWCRWALTHNIGPEIMGFIRFRPDLLNTFEQHVKNKQTGHAFATERSWEMVSDLTIDGDSSKVLSSMIAGTIGAGPAIDFATFRKTWKDMPNIDQIMMDPHGSPIPERGATAYAVSAALANRAKPDNFSTILIYAERMPREFMMLIVKDSARRNREVMSTAAFVKFSSVHSDLIM